MKYLVLIDVDCIYFCKVKKKAKTMLTKNNGLYTNETRYYVKDIRSSDAMRFNRVSSTQPVLPKAEFVDPDMIRVKIRSSKLGHKQRKTWLNMDSNNIWKWLTGIAIVGSLIYGFLVMG